MTTSNPSLLLEPILSRFCQQHVPLPLVRGQPLNLYRHQATQQFRFNRLKYWTKEADTLITQMEVQRDWIDAWINNGFSAIDLLDRLPHLPKGHIMADLAAMRCEEMAVLYVLLRHANETKSANEKMK